MRDYLLEQISLLRRPKTNVPMLQQTKLQRFSDLTVFLRAHSPRAAAEVQSTYVSVMSRLLFALFRSYHLNLLKLRTLTACGREAKRRHGVVAGGRRVEERAV